MAKIDKRLYADTTATDTTATDTTTKESDAKFRASLTKIQCAWKGDSLDEALEGAEAFGKLVFCDFTDNETAGDGLKELFTARKMPEQHWESVFKTFQNSAAVPYSSGFVIGKQFPSHDNDNESAVKPTPPPLPKMHSSPNTPEAAGGLLRLMSEWITSTAIIPVPELSLTASIALLCGMFGDKALTPLGGGINMYMVTVMRVGAGKGHAPKSIIKLANQAAKPGAVTNGDPTSYAAIERMLRKNKSTVVVMDEFGETLQDVNSHHKNSAAASIRKFLLAIYDQADSIFHGRQYASSDTKKDDSPIEGPALTVLGMTTASTLYNGLGEDSLGGGFISRFVFIEGKHSETIKAPSIHRTKGIPSALKEKLQKAVLDFPKPEGEGNLAALKKYIIPFEDDEDGEAYKRYSEIFLWQQWKGWTDLEHNINARAAENTLRHATGRAISRYAANPLAGLHVTAEDVEWGWAIVHESIAIITAGVDRFMSGSIPEALRKAIKEALRQAKDQTLTWSFLLQRQGVSQALTKDVADAVSWLIETGQVENLARGGTVGSAVRPGPRQTFRLKEPAE